LNVGRRRNWTGRKRNKSKLGMMPWNKSAYSRNVKNKNDGNNWQRITSGSRLRRIRWKPSTRQRKRC